MHLNALYGQQDSPRQYHTGCDVTLPYLPRRNALLGSKTLQAISRLVSSGPNTSPYTGHQHPDCSLYVVSARVVPGLYFPHRPIGQLAWAKPVRDSILLAKPLHDKGGTPMHLNALNG